MFDKHSCITIFSLTKGLASFFPLKGSPTISALYPAEDAIPKILTNLYI